MKNKPFLCLVSLLLVVLGMMSSCKEDSIYEPDGLFSPKFASGYPHAEKNTIKMLWYSVNGASSYRVQIARDELFEQILVDQQTPEISYVSSPLPYATNLYVRVRSNAEIESHNSIWKVAEVITEERSVEPILLAVKDSDIQETSITIRWKVDENLPADQVVLVSTDPDTTITHDISPELFAAGQMTIDDLEPNTEYHITLYNNQQEDIYERPYNTVKVKTAGPPEGAHIIKSGDDLNAILHADQGDANIADGQLYYLRSGSFDIQGFSFEKGFQLVASTGSSVTIRITKPFTPASDNAGLIHLANLNLQGSDRIIDNDADDGLNYTWQGVKLEKCFVSGFPTGFLRLQTSAGNVKRIANFTIENCIFDGMQGGRLLETNNFSDQSAISAEFQSVSIRNTTFINSPSMLLLFLPDAYGYSGSNIHLEMTNVTVFEALSYSNKRMIQMNRLPKETSTVTITKCLFSNEANAYDDSYMFYETCLCGSATTTYADNYITGSRSETGRKGVNAKPLNITQDDLFLDWYSGDLTIKDKTSAVYLNQVGDPRWLK